MIPLRTDRKITDLNWARDSERTRAWCGDRAWSGTVWGYPALVMVTVKPSAWICRMWLRSLRSVSVRAW